MHEYLALTGVLYRLAVCILLRVLSSSPSGHEPGQGSPLEQELSACLRSFSEPWIRDRVRFAKFPPFVVFVLPYRRLCSLLEPFLTCKSRG